MLEITVHVVFDPWVVRAAERDARSDPSNITTSLDAWSQRPRP
jgi:hypothetical protein